MPESSSATDEADAPRFTLSIRHDPAPTVSWRLRYEVSDGVFILRSRQAGVDVDGPPLTDSAVEIGHEDVLDSLRLRLLDRSGQRRSTYRLSQHHAIQPGRWVPLAAAGADPDGTVRLLPPDVEDEPPDAQIPDGRAVLRSESPAPARIVKHLRRELSRSRIEAETLAARVAELELRLAAGEDIDGDPTDSP